MSRSVVSSRARGRRGLRIIGVVAVLGLVMPASGAVTSKISRPGKSPFANYIVMLKPSVGDPQVVAQDQTDRPGASLQGVFRTLKGYAATFRTGDIQAVRRDPRTELVARDDTVHTMDFAVNQSNAPFGVDRVDQPTRLPVDHVFAANNDGDGVHAYVIDTGIRRTHSEFGGRVEAGKTFVNDGRGSNDCNGHGTHVAGIIGGATYGVAKAVKLVPVRTLNCSGSASTSTVIAAVDWVAQNAIKPAVANMSLGGSSNAALDLAVQKAISSGVPFSIAAGNGNFLGFAANACNTSPARVGTAMTIGASDINDAKASFSNYGSCVDWFAPGVNIVSSWYSSDTATRSLSGTSMAAPYTAGVAALYLDAHPLASPATVATNLLNLSQHSAVVSNSRTATVNSHIVFTGRGAPAAAEVL